MDRLWRSKGVIEKKQEESKKIEKQPLYLPNYIGCKIIELQMEISEANQLEKQKIIDLMQAYTEAIQFYEQNNDQKYLLYQRKMQEFVQKPIIAEIMKGKKSELTLRRQKNQQQMRKIANNHKATIKKIIETSLEENQKRQNIVRRQIETQEKKFQQRLQRKRANSNRSMKPKLTSASFSFAAKQESNNHLQSFIQVPLPSRNNEKQ